MKKKKTIRFGELQLVTPFGKASGDQDYIDEGGAIEDWFDQFANRMDKFDEFLEKYDTIAILHLIEINPEYRGKGYGKRLLEEWLSQTSAEVVVCWANSIGSHKVDYLMSFYESAGFKSDGDALMVLIRS